VIAVNDMKIGFIGSGKVGAGLGAYFAARGCRVAGYSGGGGAARQVAARHCAALTASAVFDSDEALANGCDLIFITVPDGQIAEVWRGLERCDLAGKIVCHASGCLSSGVFGGAAARGVCACSAHPMCAFPDRSGRVPGLDSAYFTVEGGGDRIKEFLTSLGNKALAVPAEKKALYHAANTAASNLVLALLYLADDCLRQSGISGEDALRAITPLILGNARNICENGFAASLTGPVERNDLATVKRHLDALPAEYGGVYARLSLILTRLAAAKHGERDGGELRRMLRGYAEGAGEKEFFS
jgi:predicted short-subunit dehydrogenase-like oxidoreductase (DUF2520 family)